MKLFWFVRDEREVECLGLSNMGHLPELARPLEDGLLLVGGPVDGVKGERLDERRRSGLCVIAARGLRRILL